MFLSFKFRFNFRDYKIDNELIKTFLLSLSAKVGVGSLVGTLYLIKSYGPGSVIWLIISNIITSSICFYESYYACKYKTIDNYGGVQYYIKNILNNKKLSNIYSILLIFCYLFGYISTQVNSISLTFNSTFNINKIFIFIFLIILIFPVINGGIKRIVNVSYYVVSIMFILFIMFFIYIISISNIKYIINIILDDAFNIKSGYILIVINSFRRYIFNSEACIGTNGIIASSCNSNNIKSISLSMVLSNVFSLIIMIMVSIIYLSSPYYLSSDLLYSLRYYFNDIVLSIIIFCLSFTSIICEYYYVENSIKYFGIKDIRFIKYFLLLIIFYSIFISLDIVLNISDFIISILVIINIISLYKIHNYK